ncbi:MULTISPECIES: NAD-dependent succinate-semialdehyde dehydrogenase [unclassified Pseudoclavibacter]|uniref:NAD-dependent succinate-semialdehyde dehydrogenase n=1 Tax=unclassified Pseudoclavibacter TaxID=2615177 RepID=UPI001300CBC0|nr:MULTISPECIES: NAD-dependent succinate-semialdehyde dehydrogenase [unclassified Pseudoclavibacter]KAB1658677.1 NAD-dependent succinate-semialdehyde dehydrogenase [Pseudoclavibacter sp. CFCC 11306]KAB1661262.1 NAD-dependent succinate-semialdehyde dehydrogenase [Pseudoclavibacter sp. CFCC 13796]
MTELIDYARSVSGLWIDNEFVDAKSGETFAVIDPSTEDAFVEVADAGLADADRALASAHEAQIAWAKVAPRQRGEVLRRAFELMIERRQQLAELISLENGKALSDALGEVTYAAEFFRWFAEEAVRIEGEYLTAPAGGVRNLVTRRPAGVAVLVTPWNFPAAMATRKIGPALAAGCATVLKPAGETPLTALAIAQILAESGLPAGLVNVLPSSHTAEIVDHLLDDQHVRVISFTGSTPVGKVLLRKAADRVLNTAMELGGNAAFVVTADADVEAAVEGALTAKFRNGGQACTAANRFFVHADIAERFTRRFIERAADLAVGAGLAEGTDIGPLVNRKSVDKVSELVAAAVRDGATVAYQSEVPETGYYAPVTVLTDVTPASPVFAEEVFGPVASIATWSDEDALIESVNDTDYGLASYVFAGELRHAVDIANRIDAGMVGVNRGLVSDPSVPFGGFKQSGVGREGGHEGIEEYQETQYFSVAWPGA